MTDRRWNCTGTGRWRELRADAPTLAQVFEDSARALVRVGFDPAAVVTRAAVHMVCGAADLDRLLLAWLESVRAEMVRRRVVFGDFQVHLRDGALAAVGFGEAASAAQTACLGVFAAARVDKALLTNPDGVFAARCQIDLGPAAEAKPCFPAGAAGSPV